MSEMGARLAFLRGRPGPVPALAFDFTRVRSLNPRVTFTRASTATYFDDAGVLQTAASGAPRFDYHPTSHVALGLLDEEARTNVILWNRDLTNAAWTASNVTVAKTATGVDGVANSASTLTATAGNGTVLQAITLASSARFQSAWVKLRTGSGVINMTTDNGSTWTAIVPTSSWSRLTIPTQTLANPTVGFRIVTSGDAIDVDYVQNENGTFATSAIATTTASVTRAADVCSILTSAFPFNASQGTIVSYHDVVGLGSSNSPVWTLDDGTDQNRIFVFQQNGGSQFTSANAFTGNSNQGRIDTTATFSANALVKSAYAWKASDRAACANGGAVATSSTLSVPTVTALELGTDIAAIWLNGHIRRLVYYSTRLSNTQLQALTA